jgi:DNA mismatch repair protein MutS2
MIEATLRVLEYDKVTGLLAQFTVTDPGRELALALRPLSTPEAVVDSLAEVTEMMTLLERQKSPPLAGCRDLRQPLRELHAEGTWLAPAVFLEVVSSVEAARDCRQYFTGRQEAPRLGVQAELLDPLREVRIGIRESIGPRGEFLDGASFELGQLRREILQTRGRIKRILEGLLASDSLSGVFQERIITERGGRYVLPVRADHRGQVKGFVHDESASGQTLFVEPAAALEANNQLQTHLREEKREEERILRRLSDLVRRQTATLLVNQQILARLDFVAAAGRFAITSGATAPHLASEPLLELREARHPLLLFNPDGSRREGEAVPVDLLLGSDCDILVVSGPNTGGKTVALKTAGLLTLMVASGLPVPCHPESRVYLFGRVFADIGDEQSIEANLSTFSGHITRMRRILAEADKESLVLLDEAGTGTDPAEGGALALAVLDTLRGRGARVVVTTHLNLVKGYAHLQQGVQNAAVEFDEVTLAPTYRLHYGIPGASSAFTIARQLGLPEEVLERAEGYLSPGERDGIEVIESLNRLSAELEGDRAEARLLLRRAQSEHDRRHLLLAELEEQKRGILDKARSRGEQIVSEAEVRLRQLLRQAREAGSDARQQALLAGELQDVRETLTDLRSEPHRKGRLPSEVVVGEILRVTVLGSDGEVVRLLENEVELTVHGKKLRQPLSALEQYAPRRFAKSSRGRGGVRSSVERDGFQPRLMLVGRRVDGALPDLDRFLDDALLHGIREVEVVHGAGEGILRRAVREFLARHREVSAYHGADLSRGGDNVTIVELRE